MRWIGALSVCVLIAGCEPEPIPVEPHGRECEEGEACAAEHVCYRGECRTLCMANESTAGERLRNCNSVTLTITRDGRLIALQYQIK